MPEETIECILREMEPEPLFSEIESAVKVVTCRKAHGLDNIPGEVAGND